MRNEVRVRRLHTSAARNTSRAWAEDNPVAHSLRNPEVRPPKRQGPRMRASVAVARRTVCGPQNAPPFQTERTVPGRLLLNTDWVFPIPRAADTFDRLALA